MPWEIHEYLQFRMDESIDVIIPDPAASPHPFAKTRSEREISNPEWRKPQRPKGAVRKAK
jgi:hypothetical protein